VPPRSAIGIDVGGTNVRAARIVGDEIAVWRSLPTASNADKVIGQILELTRSLDSPEVVAIGVGVPGRVDVSNGEVLSGGFVDFVGTFLRARLQDGLGKPVVIDNDASMALIGEAKLGAARGRSHVALLTIGTGIGGAVLSNGRILRGRATAGQLGHLAVETGGDACLCGRHGCIETWSSGTALGGLIRKAGLDPNTRAEDLLALAETLAVSARVLEAWARPLRGAIDNLVAVLDPEIVVLGGGLGIAAHQALARFPAQSTWYQCPVVPAELGDRAGVIGAAVLALTVLEVPT
jgi:glucokinase